MPNLSTYETHNFVKMLLLGDSGVGKTGALASLAADGYKIRILDYDKGVEPIVHALKKMNRMDALANVTYQTLDDKYQVIGGKVVPRGVPEAFQMGVRMLDMWSPKSSPGAEELGTPSKWGKDTILVIDSLTHMCNAALRYVQTLNANAGGKVTQPEWGMAQQIIEQMLTLLYSAEFQTNVIINAHIDYRRADNSIDDKGNPNGSLKGNPMSLGAALPPKIPSYFNIMLLAETRGVGQYTKRLLTTTPNGVINTKSPILSGIPAEMPLDTGLSTYFGVALGSKPNTATTAVPATGIASVASTKA